MVNTVKLGKVFQGTDVTAAAASSAPAA